MREKFITMIFVVCLFLIPSLSNAGSIVLLQDDFNDNIIDNSKWTTEGNYVAESGGAINIVQNQTNAGGGDIYSYFSKSDRLDYTRNESICPSRK